MGNILAMYGISLLSIILGFIALLTQRIYIDPATNKPTEIEVPIFGKMKTNYPALVFVFIGSLLAYTTFDKSYERSLEKPSPQKVDWEITGSFKIPAEDTVNIDWMRGRVNFFPCNIKNTNLGDKGTFKIWVEIDEGKNFEDEYEKISLDHNGAGATIFTDQEYDKYIKKEESLIKNATKKAREYKPKLVEAIYK